MTSMRTRILRRKLAQFIQEQGLTLYSQLVAIGGLGCSRSRPVVAIFATERPLGHTNRDWGKAVSASSGVKGVSRFTRCFYISKML